MTIRTTAEMERRLEVISRQDNSLTSLLYSLSLSISLLSSTLRIENELIVKVLRDLPEWDVLEGRLDVDIFKCCYSVIVHSSLVMALTFILKLKGSSLYITVWVFTHPIISRQIVHSDFLVNRSSRLNIHINTF